MATDRELSVQNYVHANPRKVGLLLLFIGGAMVYLKLVQPVLDAQEGAAKITISSTASMIGIIGIVLGLAYLAFGPKAAVVLRPREGESKVAAYIIGAVLAAIGIGAYYGVKQYLQSQGYTFH